MKFLLYNLKKIIKMSIQEQNEDLEFQNQLNSLLTDGQSLLNSLQNIRLRNESNYQSKFF